MELIDVLANRLIEDLRVFNNQLKELKNVLSKNKRTVNPDYLLKGKERKKAND